MMTCAEVKKYLGGRVHVRPLKRSRVHNLLVNAARNGADAALVPKVDDGDPASYIAVVNSASGRIQAVLVNCAVVTPTWLDNLRRDAARCGG